MSAETWASGVPDRPLSTIPKPFFPRGGTGSSATLSITAAGGASAGSHLAAAVILLAGIVGSQEITAFAQLAGAPLLVAAQVASASAMFAFFFRLQAVGGPVYLSQIGYVAAAVGLIAGVLFLGERYQLLTWLGAVIITAGVVMTTKAQNQAG